MTGTVTNLQDLISLDERDYAHHPVFPAIERNGRRDEIVGKRELVIEQMEEKPQDGFHARISSVDKQSNPPDTQSPPSLRTAIRQYGLSCLFIAESSG